MQHPESESRPTQTGIKVTVTASKLRLESITLPIDLRTPSFGLIWPSSVLSEDRALCACRPRDNDNNRRPCQLSLSLRTAGLHGDLSLLWNKNVQRAVDKQSLAQLARGPPRNHDKYGCLVSSLYSQLRVAPCSRVSETARFETR